MHLPRSTASTHPAPRFRRRLAGASLGIALGAMLVTGCGSEGDDPATPTSSTTTSTTMATTTTAANTTTSAPEIGSETTISPGNSQNTPDEGPGGGDEGDEQNQNENYPYGPNDSGTDGTTNSGGGSGSG